MPQYDPSVEAYIAKSADFAQPILNHIRQLVHQTSPLITETIKWGFPFFEYKGQVCQMAAFKQHCSFGFWKATLLSDPAGHIKLGDASAGSFGRITVIGDLPGDEVLKGFILQAMEINEKGIKPATTKAPVEKAPLVVPDDFDTILNNNPKAIEVFNKFSYSHKKEYLEWITEAKTEATRTKRMARAIEMMSEGKSRHHKYQ
ncbi:MAG: YdeI/OmpD-associated family protein [Mucilaginibacter sp.]